MPTSSNFDNKQDVAHSLGLHIIVLPCHVHSGRDKVQIERHLQVEQAKAKPTDKIWKVSGVSQPCHPDAVDTKHEPPRKNRLRFHNINHYHLIRPMFRGT